MKVLSRFVSALTVGIMMISTLPLNTSAAVLRGDVNGDGSINLVDQILLNKYLAGIVTFEDLTPLDFDADHIVCQADADKLIRFLTHLPY